MAILYGTTAEGNTYPVQVDEFGRLVTARPQGGSDGGNPGGGGEPGESVELTHGEFSPVFVSKNDAAEAFIEYEKQQGFWYRFGPLVTVVMSVRTSSVVMTNPRGELMLGGLPQESQMAVPSLATRFGPYSIGESMLSGRSQIYRPSCEYIPGRGGFVLGERGGSDPGAFLFAELWGSDHPANEFHLTFQGLAADSVRSVPGLLDDLV